MLLQVSVRELHIRILQTEEDGIMKEARENKKNNHHFISAKIYPMATTKMNDCTEYIDICL